MKGILPLAHISILKLPAMQLKLVFKEKSFASLNELLGCKSFFQRYTLGEVKGYVANEVSPG